MGFGPGKGELGVFDQLGELAALPLFRVDDAGQCRRLAVRGSQAVAADE